MQLHGFFIANDAEASLSRPPRMLDSGDDIRAVLCGQRAVAQPRAGDLSR